MNAKTRNYLHAIVIVIAVWFLAKGFAGLMGVDLEAMIGGLLR